jgi:hypothetical protein
METLVSNGSTNFTPEFAATGEAFTGADPMLSLASPTPPSSETAPYLTPKHNAISPWIGHNLLPYAVLPAQETEAPAWKGKTPIEKNVAPILGDVMESARAIQGALWTFIVGDSVVIDGQVEEGPQLVLAEPDFITPEPASLNGLEVFDGEAYGAVSTESEAAPAAAAE